MMETLFVVAQHRNQYCGRDINQQGQPRFDVGSPSPLWRFGKINCRTFESSSGLLPTPCNELPSPVPAPAPAPLAKQTSASGIKNKLQSTPVAIPLKVRGVEKDDGVILDEFFNRRVCYSELWAGPAYSNSPPPSSLPIPKFSFRGKRTVSLDFPNSAVVGDGFMVHSSAKSAPASPTRAEYWQSSKVLFNSADSATQALRRILNLDDGDD